VDASLFCKLQSGKPPLRIGLLLDSAKLPRCFAEVVDHILQSDFAQLELLVFNAETQLHASQPRPARPAARKLIEALVDRKRRPKLLYSLYERWDQRHIDPADDPLAWVDCSARFAHIESFSVTPITKRFVHRFPAEAIERIREKGLDVLIRFGFNILRGEILTAAKYGIWSYHHGDNDYYRGGPAYFWEVYEGNPLSGAVLQVLTDELDAGKVLYKGIFTTYAGISQVRNRTQPYWGASTFMIQKLRELQEYGWDHVERNVVQPSPYLGRKKIYSQPTNWEMLRWLGPWMLCRTGLRLARRPAVQHWRVALRAGASPVVNSTSAPDLAGFRWIESPPGRFYADPFLLESGGETWAFFEDYDYARQRGKISCAKVRAGELVEPVTALERPYHLSYPCVFRDGEQLYLLPETESTGAVELYRCVHFPEVWRMERELFQAHAVDTTVWVEDGLYWFFVTMHERRGHATQLWLFYAETLTGKWTAHPANPLSTDVRNSRGGGAIFRHHGKLFRPSQDCSREYGGSFTLNEIVILNRREYREKPQVRVRPPWGKGWLGTHTYSLAGDIEMIDGCVRLPARRVL
jgi:hypothetical protein